MTTKRRNSSSVEPDEPPSKRPYPNEQSNIYSPGHSDERPRLDSETGQSGAFPGLIDEDEIFYGPALDGIDYLRMVRSERKGIPNLLTTIKSPQQDELNEGGHYYDGAYTAAPEQTLPSDSFDLAQQYYYDSLLVHFRLIRATMRCVPPVDKIQELGEQRPISFPASSKAARKTWESQIFERNPSPVQLACMEWESILHLIQLVNRKMMQFFKPNRPEHVERIGAWIWAALGSIPDKGELSGDEVAELRAFAERAIKVSSWVDSKQLVSGLSDNDDDDSLGEEEDSVNQIAVDFKSTDDDRSKVDEGHTFESDQVEHECAEVVREASKRKMIILDAITTVVGESYGQRDLLKLRKIWTKSHDLE